jgi:hypothetical protein
VGQLGAPPSRAVQTPWLQTESSGQAVPQLPQFSGSVSDPTQPPPELEVEPEVEPEEVAPLVVLAVPLEEQAEVAVLPEVVQATAQVSASNPEKGRSTRRV